MKLLTVENAKTVKGEKKGILTGILYLAPHTLANGVFNTCPWSDAACRSVCLYTAGRGRFDKIQEARIRKTQFLIENKTAFITQLYLDIGALVRKAIKLGATPAIRLNGTSDIRWYTKEYGEIPTKFPDVQFYDYTKEYARVIENTLPNYHLTYSRNSVNTSNCVDILKRGYNVAAIFRGELPETLWGYPVISGDEDDVRFLDPSPVVVGLKAKGDARSSTDSIILDAVA